MVLARFVPVVRTLAPVLAGASGTGHRRFTTSNVLGGILWGGGVTVLGHALGQVGFVRTHLELILLGIVVLSAALPAVAVLRSRWQAGTDRVDA